MTIAVAIEKIEASKLNASQKRAALRLMSAMKKNTQSSIEGDTPEYVLHVGTSDYCSHVSFSCFGKGTLYAADLHVVIGPRGGKKVLSAYRRFSDLGGGAGNFYI